MVVHAAPQQCEPVDVVESARSSPNARKRSNGRYVGSLSAIGTCLAVLEAAPGLGGTGAIRVDNGVHAGGSEGCRRRVTSFFWTFE